MGHSKLFLTAREKYRRRLWSAGRLKALVGLATGITAEEYDEITGAAEPAEKGGEQ